MKPACLLVSFALSFAPFATAALGEELLGDYVLVMAPLGDGDPSPHALNAISARITKHGDKYEITVDDIQGNEPSTVPLYVEGKRLSFFLPPRKFTRDGKSHMSIAKAYFGEIVLELYIAGWAAYGERSEAFKLKRVKPIPDELDSN